MEGRGGVVSHGDDGAGLEGSGGDEIMMRGWRVFGGAEGAGVDDGSLESAS